MPWLNFPTAKSNVVIYLLHSTLFSDILPRMNIIIKKDPYIRSKPEDLIDFPIVIRVDKFNDESAKKFSDAMTDAHNTGQPIIPIIIDSYGGEVYSLLSMISDIRNSKLPVATIAAGKAMSCGSILLSCGTEGYRFMDEHAVVMIHDVFNFCCGKVEEAKSQVAETERIQKQIFHLMSKNCGHKDPEYFTKIIHQKGHAEWYLTPQEAKKHRLINHVKVPSLTTNISIQTTLE